MKQHEARLYQCPMRISHGWVCVFCIPHLLCFLLVPLLLVVVCDFRIAPRLGYARIAYPCSLVQALACWWCRERDNGLPAHGSSCAGRPPAVPPRCRNDQHDIGRSRFPVVPGGVWKASARRAMPGRLLRDPRGPEAPHKDSKIAILQSSRIYCTPNPWGSKGQSPLAAGTQKRADPL
jgi:hypothetical protein